MTKKFDELSAMMAWEEGTLNRKDTIRLFQHLIDNGMAWQLQGIYGRFATILLRTGVCHYPSKQVSVEDTNTKTRRMKS